MSKLDRFKKVADIAEKLVIQIESEGYTNIEIVWELRDAISELKTSVHRWESNQIKTKF